MRYYWDLIRHFFIANSRHGTHSPFVYALASRVIYHVSRARPLSVNGPADFHPKYRNLLLDILDYMKVGELAPFGTANHADALVVELGGTSSDRIIEAVRAGKIIVVLEPFRTGAAKRSWLGLIQSPDVVVSINLFHFGLLMYREGQQKENFLLRYPFWRK